MIKRISRIVALTTPGLMLAMIGLAALPAGQAQASTSIVSYWGSSSSPYEATFSCSTPAEYNEGANPVIEVYNPCGGRVWVHYNSQAYCVNPGGLAYAIPSSELQWSNGDTANIQLTSNTSQCDSSGSIPVAWENGAGQGAEIVYNCDTGASIDTGYYIEQASNSTCDTRLWLHEDDNGGGNSFCFSPYTGTANFSAGAYWQLAGSENQAPCNAGDAPYSY
jgi:hypothetical protein